MRLNHVDPCTCRTASIMLGMAHKVSQFLNHPVKAFTCSFIMVGRNLNGDTMQCRQ